MITHIDDGLDFLGWRIQRHRKRGTDRHYVYTYPARKAVQAVTGKVKTLCRRMDTNQPLPDPAAPAEPDAAGLVRLLPARRVQRHLQLPERLHLAPGLRMVAPQTPPDAPWKELRRRYCGGGWWPGTNERQLFDPAKVRTTRYRYRGAVIPSPWPATG